MAGDEATKRAVVAMRGKFPNLHPSTPITPECSFHKFERC